MGAPKITRNEVILDHLRGGSLPLAVQAVDLRACFLMPVTEALKVTIIPAN